jgi:hypothetical protein
MEELDDERQVLYRLKEKLLFITFFPIKQGNSEIWGS